MAEHEQDLVHRHERSDVAPRWPIYVGAGMLLLLPISVAIVSTLMHTLWAPEATSLDPFAHEQRSISAPHLQVDPQADLAALQARWRKRLNSYGWIDRERGLVHVPIDRAMQRLAETGLPEPARQPGPARSVKNARPGDAPAPGPEEQRR